MYLRLKNSTLIKVFDVHKRKEIIKFKKLFNIYKNNPVAFAEEYLGVKLRGYQKLILKMRRREYVD